MSATITMPGGGGSTRLTVANTRGRYRLLHFAFKLQIGAASANRQPYLCLVVDGVTTFRLPSNEVLADTGAIAYFHFAPFHHVGSAASSVSIIGPATLISGPLPIGGLIVQPSEKLQLVIDGGQSDDVISEVNLISLDESPGVSPRSRLALADGGIDVPAH